MIKIFKSFFGWLIILHVFPCRYQAGWLFNGICLGIILLAVFVYYLLDSDS